MQKKVEHLHEANYSTVNKTSKFLTFATKWTKLNVILNELAQMQKECMPSCLVPFS